MIKVGDTLPATTLMEYNEVEGEGCSIGPVAVDVSKATAGKTIALFALPGAFTPTCSAKHVPGYAEQADAFKAAGLKGSVEVYPAMHGWVPPGGPAYDAVQAERAWDAMFALFSEELG